MAIKVTSGFDVRSKSAIDTRIVLTKAEMLAVNEKLMPANYFCICSDDGKFYIYNATFAQSAETGRFRSYEEVMNITSAINKALESEETKAALEQAVAEVVPGAIADAMQDSEKAQKIADSMFDSEHFEVNLDNKIDLAVSLIQAIDGN